jgi:hypothetical protein
MFIGFTVPLLIILGLTIKSDGFFRTYAYARFHPSSDCGLKHIINIQYSCKYLHCLVPQTCFMLLTAKSSFVDGNTLSVLSLMKDVIWYYIIIGQSVSRPIFKPSTSSVRVQGVTSTPARCHYYYKEFNWIIIILPTWSLSYTLLPLFFFFTMRL